MINSIQDDELRTKETLKLVLDELDWKRNNKGKIVGLSTGYPELDKIISGLQRGKLYCLAARHSIGKSSLALNISLNWALKLQKETLIFSLEESAKKVLTRLLSIHTMIDFS